ncbi:MAG: hypothetical protein MJ210_00110 [Alphaproteobacteria bacterium]|nr:hypothetical protein [Alphaproteobacteria bacterium]
MRCTGALEASVAIVIGYVPTKTGGGRFISSTDWRLKMGNGETGILQFSIHPNHSSFVECRAREIYSTDNYGEIKKDVVKKRARVVIGDKFWVFEPGQPLIVPVLPGDVFIATDCEVEVDELNIFETVYRVKVTTETEFGEMKSDGSIVRH